jgi:hypothetical protein
MLLQKLKIWKEENALHMITTNTNASSEIR